MQNYCLSLFYILEIQDFKVTSSKEREKREFDNATTFEIFVKTSSCNCFRFTLIFFVSVLDKYIPIQKKNKSNISEVHLHYLSTTFSPASFMVGSWPSACSFSSTQRFLHSGF